MLKLKELIRKIVVWINDNLILKTYGYNDFTYSSGFTYYNTTDYAPIATKQGRVVTLNGAFKNTAQKSAGLQTIGYVPVGCEPLFNQVFLSQPKGTMNRLLVQIYPDGHISIDRYGTTSSIAIPANSRLMLNHSYISKN